MKKEVSKKIVALMGIALFLSPLPNIANAEPVVIFKRDDYKIHGNTIEEIKRSISDNAPKKQYAKGFSGLTKYEISWKYKFDKSNNLCKIASVKTFVTITQHLPQLENTSQLDNKTKNKWETYYSALKLHEDGHASLGIEAASEIEKEIAKMPAEEDCRELSVKANKIGREIINFYHQKNKDYDQTTAHGHLQGAFLASYESFL